MYGALSSGKLWGLLIAIFGFALGGVVLGNLVCLLPQRAILDENRVRVHSCWRSGYLSWTQIEEATFSGQTGHMCLRDSSKKLSVSVGSFPRHQREAFAKALQYYLTLREVPIQRRDRLLP